MKEFILVGHKHLFNNQSISVYLMNRKSELLGKIKNLKESYFIENTIEELIDELEKEYKINIPILVTEKDQITQESEEVNFEDVSQGYQRYVMGTKITLTLKFSGDRDVFLLDPVAGPIERPIALPGHDSLILCYEYHKENANPEQISKQILQNFDQKIALIQKLLSQNEMMVKQYNGTLRQEIKKFLEERQKQFFTDKQVTANLGFSIKKDPMVADLYKYPLAKKEIKKTSTNSTSSKTQDDPFLEMKDYEDILKTCFQMGQVMERSPDAFKGIGEETLRFHFLIPLNGIYSGKATGETFNFDGKTDILIRDKGKNIFIAECKFWDGPKLFIETIDQILGYLTWRDTKAAIFIFNKNKNLTGVLEKVKEAASKHPNCIRDLGKFSETGFRYVFHHRDDEKREIMLTVLVFEIPEKWNDEKSY